MFRVGWVNGKVGEICLIGMRWVKGGMGEGCLGWVKEYVCEVFGWGGMG